MAGSYFIGFPYLILPICTTLLDSIIKSFNNKGRYPVTLNLTPRIAIIINVNLLSCFPGITMPARFSGRFNFEAPQVFDGFVLTINHISFLLVTN
jgi:hypothetical protein